MLTDLIGAILPLITALLGFEIPGIGITFGEFAIFLFTLQLIGIALHIIYHDKDGPKSGSGSWMGG